MSNIIPPALLKTLKEKYFIDEEQFLKVHEDQETVTSVRLNPFKPANIFDTSEAIPWCERGRYLAQRPSFIADPLFHAGCYYVQESSSMFIEHALRCIGNLQQQLRVLDLCAAPGGKSTLIASLLSKESLLVSNEIIRNRVPVLAENMNKWGNLNSIVSNNDPKDFRRLGGYFDIIVADAPCSGSGMWRKDPQTVNEWSEKNVQLCSQRQQRILADVFPALKAGGILVYSTCSYSPEENEDIADWMADTFEVESLKIPLEDSWNIIESRSEKRNCYGYRFYPHKVRGEGLFISCFRKKGQEAPKLLTKDKTSKREKINIGTIRDWLNSKDDIEIIQAREGYAGVLRNHTDDLRLLQNNLYIKKSGVYLGKMAGKDLIPDHELALSLALNPEIPRHELPYDQAIAFLRKDEIKLEQASTGWGLMCYQGYGIGWAKVLPNRINNYLPKELRILKEIG